MESQSSLVRTKGGVELDSVSPVNLELALVIFPDDRELNNALWDGNDLESGFILWVLFENGAFFEG
jgi:hypothetical protein